MKNKEALVEKAPEQGVFCFFSMAMLDELAEFGYNSVTTLKRES